MRQHQYRDVSNLNAPYDDMSLQGLGDIGSLGGGGLGFNMEDEHNIPWMGEESHPAVIAAQQTINKDLQADGYGPVLVDGILGPRTCGALNLYAKGGLVYNNCEGQDEMSPVKASSEWHPPMKTSEQAAAENAAAQQNATLARAGGGGMPSWVWGILAAGGAIGVAIYIKKKKKGR